MGVFDIFEQFHSLGDLCIYSASWLLETCSVYMSTNKKKVYISYQRFVRFLFFFIKENVGFQFLCDMLDIFWCVIFTS